MQHETVLLAPQASVESLIPVPVEPVPEQQIGIRDNRVEITIETEASEPQIEQKYTPRRHVVGRVVAAVAFVGCMMLGGERQAEAAPPGTVTVEAQAQASDPDFGVASLFISVAGALTAIAAITKQGKDKNDDRFQAALQGLKGESTGEERVLRLHALTPYAKSRKYAPDVFDAAAAYLRGRRGGLELLYHGISDKKQLEHAIMERRNADRSALKLLLATLPAAQRQVRMQTILTRARAVAGKKTALQRLDELTGVQVDEEKIRVNARGVCLDDMRDIKRCNLEGVDLTGAGLQKNQITSVVFTDARLCEAQFEGTTVSRCDLRQADLRAAHFHGAIFDGCVVDAETKFGNLPDSHPDARYGSLRPDEPDKHRGNPRVILKDLKSDTLSEKQIQELVWSWQENGLVLLEGSTPDYSLSAKRSQ